MTHFWQIEFEEASEKRSQRYEKDFITLGRSSENDIQILKDLQVSSVHCRLFFDGESIIAEDLNSTNGVYVQYPGKNEKINKMARISNPASIRIGQTLVVAEYFHTQDHSNLVKMKNWRETFHGQMKAIQLEESILVLDMCNSTLMANQYGDQTAIHLKSRLVEISDSVWDKHPANFVKNTGDGFFATFNNAQNALDAAMLLKNRIQYRNKTSDFFPLEVRMSLHKGKTLQFSNDLPDRHGNDLNIAFKLEKAQASDFISKLQFELPEKNRVLASGEFIRALDSRQNQFLSIGQVSLKGIRHPVEVFILPRDSNTTEIYQTADKIKSSDLHHSSKS